MEGSGKKAQNYSGDNFMSTHSNPYMYMNLHISPLGLVLKAGAPFAQRLGVPEQAMGGSPKF